MSNTSVLQDWLVEIPIRMQSTLVLGLRGPDGFHAPAVKEWTRWLRGLAFKPGNPDNVRQFMHVDCPALLVEKSPIALELYQMPQHYYSHLMHAIEVIAQMHPDSTISGHAAAMYMAMCDAMHLRMEPYHDFMNRLGTRAWPGGGQPDTAQDALRMLGEL